MTNCYYCGNKLSLEEETEIQKAAKKYPGITCIIVCHVCSDKERKGEQLIPAWKRSKEEPDA